MRLLLKSTVARRRFAFLVASLSLIGRHAIGANDATGATQSMSTQSPKTIVQQIIPELQQRTQQQRRHRRMGDTAATGTTENTLPSTPQLRLTVECIELPLFTCPTCAAALRQQQTNVQETIQTKYPNAKLLSTSQKLRNYLFWSFPTNNSDDEQFNSAAIERGLRQMDGVKRVFPGEEFYATSSRRQTATSTSTFKLRSLQFSTTFDEHFLDALQQIGVDSTVRSCSTGANVTVAVLDTGIDYTHQVLGGPGTVQAYKDAYGTTLYSIENTARDGLFPTERVVEGYDFIGETYQATDVGQPDDDPIDRYGHGTGVSHAIIAVAPNVHLIAVKVCDSAGFSCPDFAILSGLEYALDPNDDGSIDDHVDIVNLSLGGSGTSPYFSNTGALIDDVFRMGSLTVVAAGNDGDIPYIAGGEATTPNCLAVGATEVATDPSYVNIMTNYSSRGPGEENLLKPDLVAPGGPFFMADAGTGTDFFEAQGTSFAAPIVAGVAALIKERCPECSPFAIKTILMNHATRNVAHTSDFPNVSIAPVSLMGSGLVQVSRALNADFWAYCQDDVQPSISLGLINAATDITISKRIRVQSISGQSESIVVSYLFREERDAESGAVVISFSTSTLTLDPACGAGVAEFNITFAIDASKAPPNAMSFVGNKLPPYTIGLDKNEVDGFILLNSDRGQEVSLPFHMILRQAADVQLSTTASPDWSNLPAELPGSLTNRGAGVAQVDVFELIYLGQDLPEDNRGGDDYPGNFQYIGYRVIPADNDGCSELLEVAIHTWERQQALHTITFFVGFFSGSNGTAEFGLFNAGQGTPWMECRVDDLKTDQQYCTAFAPDHATNTATTVLRMCTDDIQAFGFQRSATIGALAITNPTRQQPSDSTPDLMIWISSSSALAVPSFDIQPGQTWYDIPISGTGVTPDGSDPIGLLFITNGYRSPNSTGAAIPKSEAIVVVRDGVQIPSERTKDDLVYPVANNTQGPGCNWKAKTQACVQRRLASKRYSRTKAIDSNHVSRTRILTLYYPNEEFDICPILDIPRAALVTQSPVVTPPSPTPSLTPTSSPLGPTIRPTRPPSSTPAPFIDPNSLKSLKPIASSSSSAVHPTFAGLVAMVAALILYRCG